MRRPDDWNAFYGSTYARLKEEGRRIEERYQFDRQPPPKPAPLWSTGGGYYEPGCQCHYRPPQYCQWPCPRCGREEPEPRPSPEEQERLDRERREKYVAEHTRTVATNTKDAWEFMMENRERIIRDANGQRFFIAKSKHAWLAHTGPRGGSSWPSLKMSRTEWLKRFRPKAPFTAWFG